MLWIVDMLKEISIHTLRGEGDCPKMGYCE